MSQLSQGEAAGEEPRHQQGQRINGKRENHFLPDLNKREKRRKGRLINQRPPD